MFYTTAGFDGKAFKYYVTKIFVMEPFVSRNQILYGKIITPLEVVKVIYLGLSIKRE